MAWNSSLLGSNIVSDYTHIDNLRNDIVAGKDWDAGETKSLNRSHDGTDGLISTSSGVLKLASTGAAVRVTAVADGSGAYLKLAHDATRGLIAASTGPLYLNRTGDDDSIYVGRGTLQSKLYLYDTTLAAWKSIAIDNGAVVIA